MAKNSLMINNSIKAPCRYCSERKAPKTCEANCEKWKEYQKNKQLISESVRQKKKVESMLIERYNNCKRK